MSFYFPDQMIHGSQGRLRPYDIRFDPDDVAHLGVAADGSVRVRLLVEPGFIEAALVEDDGRVHPLTRRATSRRFDVWELRFVPARRRFRFTFALRDGDGRPVYRVPAGVGNAVERLDRWELDLDTHPVLDVPEWARGTVIYQIFPERFDSGDPLITPPDAQPWGSEPHWLEFMGGDLRGIADRADYLAELGVGLVYLNPIFTSPSTHRYDAMDYYEVDPALGGNDALRHLVAELHERDIRIILDASFNHCHPRFFAFRDVIENGLGSDYADWFIVTDHPPRAYVRPDKVAARFDHPDEYLEYVRRFREEAGIPVETVSGEGPPVELTYDAWYGVPSLPRVDLSNPDAREYFLRVARHWVAEYGIDGWRMDVARYVDFDFWPEFRSAVKDVNPDAYLIAEIMGDAMPWLQGTTFDATMNYTFRQLVLDFVAQPVADAGDLVDGLVRMYAAYAPEVIDVSQSLLGSHDTARFLHEAGEDRSALHLGTVLQMTLPGAPGLYYGDEVGMTGGHEPGSRGAFPWHDEESWDHEQLALVRSLGRLRGEHAALRVGAVDFVWYSDDAVAYVRSHEGERVMVVVNRGPAIDSTEIACSAEAAEVVLGGGAVVAGPVTRITVPARSSLIAVLWP